MKGKFLRPCLSENIFILLSHLIDSMTEYRTLGRKLLSLRILKAFLHHLLVSNVYIEESEAILIPDPLYVTCFYL